MTTIDKQKLEADIERARAEYEANEASVKHLRQREEQMKAELDRRIQETFASEFAALAEAGQQYRSFYADVAKPQEQRYFALLRQQKHFGYEPGQEVTWMQSEGWGGDRPRRAVVVQVTATRVQIELLGKHVGGQYVHTARTGETKWVASKSLRG